MQCRKQPRFLLDKPVPISHLFEVRLTPGLWNRIQLAKMRRRRTYSTITRYCALRLARKCSLRWTRPLRAAEARVKEANGVASGMHRHMMCLYGQDEKIIRLAALELGLTITAFVRLALELFLPVLAMEKHSRSYVSNVHLTEEAIRITKSTQIFAVNAATRLFYRHLSCEYFDVESYW